ncbi:hypothetical protein [Rugamonas sp.]|uniref:hypothetical protein n=1 Tax=Rugamonas sp. TaxID=1926287 RepID=UPI0025ED9E43|nr:hypothetical protein [Rugamonas sp.]
MNQVLAAAPSANTFTPPPIGTPLGGGFFTGIYQINGQRFALITAGVEGALRGTWNDSMAKVAGASSRCDGLANTVAMAAAGSKLAQDALALRIGGFDDWGLPAKDEQDMQYCAFKPTARKNWDDRDNGINPSSLPVGEAYTKDFPLQTIAENFREGGADAFPDDWHWSSTQRADDSASAWCQNFGDGTQDYFRKSFVGAGRAFRRFPI